MSENVSKILTRITTYDGSADPYDHEISLVDTTDPGNGARPRDEPQAGSRSASTDELARKGTRESLKSQFTRRKYARYQQERYQSKTSGSATAQSQPSR